MSTRQKRNSNWHRLLVPVFCAVLSAYFIYHSYTGRYGLESHSEMVEKSVKLKSKLAALKSVRKELETRVLLMKDGSIEYDMLDEQARYKLNLLQEDEIAIMRISN